MPRVIFLPARVTSLSPIAASHVARILLGRGTNKSRFSGPARKFRRALSCADGRIYVRSLPDPGGTSLGQGAPLTKKAAEMGDFVMQAKDPKDTIRVPTEP